jgi:hypothetical protein
MFFSADFWRFTSERAIKSFAQSLLAILSVGGLGVLEVNWVTALSTSGMATLLSVLTSIGSAGVGPKNDPSVVSATDASPQPAPGRQPVVA